MRTRIRFLPATADTWPGLLQLFGKRGACAGCWCMWFRLKRAAWKQGQGDDNKRELQKLVSSGEPTGVLAFDGDRAIGWCSIAPREQYVALQSARTLKPIDDQPVWSIVCLFVAKECRQQGVSLNLIKAAVKFAKSRGANIVEAYPPIYRKERVPDLFAFMGSVSAFERAGFEIVAKPTPSRVIMRRYLSRPKSLR